MCHRSIPSRPIGLALIGVALVASGATARAQGPPPPGIVVGSTPIALPAAPNGFGIANPYPLQIPVSGLEGTVDVKVRLRGFSHTRPADVSIIVVSPNGVATFLISDPISGPVSGLTLEFENGAAVLPATQLVSGKYRPSATFPNDMLPAPAPLGPYGLTLPTLPAAQANGTWQIWAADDFGGESGSIDGVDLIFSTTAVTDTAALPDVGTAEFPLVIGGVGGAIGHVTVRMLLFHPMTSHIDVSLLSPDGTEVDLTSGNGTGANYGELVCVIRPPVCVPTLTTFDDDARTSVTAGANPFTSPLTYLPEQPLALFEGKSGAAANGVWRLRVRDRVAGSVGSIYRVELRVSEGGPFGSPDAYTTPYQTALVVPAPGVLGNDDPQGAGGARAAVVSAPASGQVTMVRDGSFTYTPAPGFVGVDTFWYRPGTDEGIGLPVPVSITVAHPAIAQAPSALRVAAMDGDTVTFRWTAPAIGPAPTGYLLEGGGVSGAATAAIATGPAPTWTLAVPTGSWFVRVRTVVGADISPPSNELAVHVNVPVAPSPPASLLGMVNGTSVTLSWQNTFDGGAPAGFDLHAVGPLSAVVPLPPGESATFSGVPPGTYDLTLRAVNAGGISGPSNVVRVSVPAACSGAPAPPRNLLVYRTGSTVHVAWDPPDAGPAVAGYVLNVSGAYVGSMPVAGRSFSSPAPPGTYVIRAAAANACGVSADTPAQTIVVP